MKKLSIISTILAGIALLAGGGILWWSMIERSLTQRSPALTPTQILEVTPTRGPTVSAEEEEEESDLEQIKEAFAENYDKDVGEVEANIGENAGTYATGGVRFEGEVGGAMWLAYDDGEKWIIAHDGQGPQPARQCLSW